MTDLFKQASIRKFRFTSNKGELTVEQLWDLPLKAKNGFDLDSVARAVNADLKAVTEESFVETRGNPAKTELEQKLELVKQIIADRMAQNAELLDAANRKARRDKLMGLLADKQDESLKGLSEEELKAEIAALDKAT